MTMTMMQWNVLNQQNKRDKYSKHLPSATILRLQKNDEYQTSKLNIKQLTTEMLTQLCQLYYYARVMDIQLENSFYTLKDRPLMFCHRAIIL